MFTIKNASAVKAAGTLVLATAMFTVVLVAARAGISKLSDACSYAMAAIDEKYN